MEVKEQKNTLTLVLVIGLVLVSLLLAYNYTVKEVKLVAQEDRDTVTVSGTATQTVEPDKAEVYLRVRTEGPTSREAQVQGAKIVNNIIDALQSAGLAKKKMENVQYSLQRDEQWNPETNKAELKGYVLAQVLKVNIDDLDQTGHFVDVGAQAGAQGVDRIVFTLTKEKEATAKKDVLGLAAKEAKQKADILASSLGVSLQKLVGVSESSFHYIPFRASSAGDVVFAAAEKSGTQVPTQGIEVSATVSAVYTIEE